MKTSPTDSPLLEPTLSDEVNQISHRNAPTWTAVIVIAVITALLGLSGGLILNTVSQTQGWFGTTALPAVATGSNGAHAVDFEEFWKVWDMIQNDYVERTATDQTLFYGALRGIVRSADDPYSDFFTPEEARQLNAAVIEGSFEGIGAEIGKKDDGIVVIAALSGSPAEAAGLQTDDLILLIDGASTADMRIDQAVTKIRGTKGTTVLLTILRPGEDTPQELTVTRNTITQLSVEHRLIQQDQQSVAVIEVHQFTQDTADLFQAAVNDVVLQQPTGVIVDVRGNPGGLLDSAVRISSLFIAEGQPVVIEQSADGTEKTLTASGSSPLQAMPTVILINGGSASASEIFAGALHDHERATLIGTTTFGKGSVQELFNLKDGALVKLTIAHWLTPDHHQINRRGIDPDYEVKPGKKDFPGKQDTQLDAAVQYLVNKDVFLKKHQVYVVPES